eukprot:SAG11_NODE_27190_length_335_cov_2.466102_1_plen_70_part_01
MVVLAAAPDAPALRSLRRSEGGEVPWLSGVHPQFLWLVSLLWALEVRALRGPSQRALGRTMEVRVAESVA